MVSLNKLFNDLQKEMSIKMNKDCHHSPSKGDITEEQWREFFCKYLPKRYSCDKAFIIDHKGNISDQIDIVIYDEHFSPFIFNQNSMKYIPAESVYAIFEVKPKLSKENFKYAQQKAKSVRKLLRTTATVISNGEPKIGRKPTHIIAGMLTTKQAWEKTLISQKADINSFEFLDIGCCVAGKSWVWNQDKYVLSKKQKDSLLTFFMKLLEMLQQQGTVPAMEINKYFNGF